MKDYQPLRSTGTTARRVNHPHRACDRSCFDRDCFEAIFDIAAEKFAASLDMNEVA